MHLTEILIRENRMFIKILIAIKNLLRHAMNHKDVTCSSHYRSATYATRCNVHYETVYIIFFFLGGGVQLNLYTQTMLI